MSARLPAHCARWLLAAALGALSACSSFNAEWSAAGNPATAQGRTRWDGRWTSATHRTRAGAPEGGRLRCVLAPTVPASGAGGTGLRAAFRANWLAFTSDYTMEFQPVKGSRTEFRGTHELPAIFGGTYRYTARMAGDRFTTRYDSSYDHGTFELSRVRP